jgi:hypothetical protein
MIFLCKQSRGPQASPADHRSESRLSIPRRGALQRSSSPLPQPPSILRRAVEQVEKYSSNGKCLTLSLSQVWGAPQTVQFCSFFDLFTCRVAHRSGRCSRRGREMRRKWGFGLRLFVIHIIAKKRLRPSRFGSFVAILSPRAQVPPTHSRSQQAEAAPGSCCSSSRESLLWHEGLRIRQDCRRS